MKKLSKILLLASLMLGLSASLHANVNKTPVIRIVNFKTAVENSKLGKKEQEAFEGLKGQMEKVVEEKQKELNEIASKLDDADYVDSLTPEAETEMKRKFRAMNQEFVGMQNQYYQLLQQANVKIVQKIAETVSKASETVAKNNQFDIVLNEDGSFFNNPAFDISDLVVKEMDVIFEQELKTQPQPNTPATPQKPVGK